MTSIIPSSKENSRISEEERERFLAPLSPSSITRRSSFMFDDVINKNEVLELNDIREENEDDLDSLTDVDFEKDQNEDLDNIISSIGMGKFQKRLLVLCGFGWVSDACVSIIMPRVQIQFQVPNSVIGLLSSSQYFGMMIGAIFWGIMSDAYGRKLAFSWTLGVTVIFGFCASLSQTFGQLCFMFFMLGFGVGGNLPVDGAIFLEFVPKESQYLLTYSSVFFECGAVFTSLIGYLILPSHSCFDGIAACDVSKENNGWRYVIAILGTCILVMFVVRILFFRLLESPKFLMSHNRQQEAIFVFQEIARINGSELVINLNDLTPPSRALSQVSSTHTLLSSDPDKIRNKSRDILAHMKQKIIPQFNDIKHLFSKEWLPTTLIVWSMWGLISFGSVMFNIYLPTYLENLEEEEHKKIDGSEAIRDGLKGFVIYSVWGIPGAIIAAYMVESFLGRKGTMAIAAAGTSISILLFSFIHHHSSVVIFSMIIGCLKTINWAVIYCYTPEVFETKVRGTASGFASVCARLTGMVSPIITGILISLGASAPLYVTTISFGLLAIFVIMLPIETRGRQA